MPELPKLSEPPKIPILPKPQPINSLPSGLKSVKKKFINFEKLPLAIVILIFLVVSVIIAIIFYYNIQLSPVGGNINILKKVEIVSGSTSGQISKELQSLSIIRNSTAFDIYTRLANKNNVLKSGVYRLSPAESVAEIVDHLSKGATDTFNITFYPGATLKDITNTPRGKKYDVTTVLENVGYSDTEISAALAAKYETKANQLLFAGRPATADLEGYVYGETYNFNTGATVEDILKGTFEEFYKVVQDNNLVKDFASHGLNLYKGITLASIVQREINSPQGTNQPTQDQKQAAQVFYSRLAIGDILGSDVTYQYIADKTGVARDSGIDSPYNTRLYPSLPPGPIAVPGITALLAVAQPATTDYLYFLSGDDNVTYFARTNAEHEANKANHCQIKCAPGKF